MIWLKGFATSLLRRRGNPIDGAQNAAIAHAVGDDVDRFSAAAFGEIGHKIGDRPLARLDRRLVRRIAFDRAARRPAEKRHRSPDGQIEPDLRRAQRRRLKRDVVAADKDHRMAPSDKQ
jgi:hypothetical protein